MYNKSCILPKCTIELLLLLAKYCVQVGWSFVYIICMHCCLALHFIYVLNNICWRRFLHKFIEWSWVQWISIQCKSYITYGCKWISGHTFHSYGLNFLEFSILNIMLLNVCDFHESWHMEAIVVAFTHAPQNWVMCRRQGMPLESLCTLSCSALFVVILLCKKFMFSVFHRI